NNTIAAYTLTSSQSILDGQTLISQGEEFELGFFSPTNTTKNRYLGIWYNLNIVSVRTVVWVANRESPLNDTSGVLKIGATGNIVIVNQTEGVIWSSNSWKTVDNPIIEFLESGNLVLRDVNNSNSESYVWQSFDYPGDTWLPGMKLGWNLKTGINRVMSSWKNFDDPSYGDFTNEMAYSGYSETFLRKGSRKIHRCGPWNGLRFSGAQDMKTNTIFTYEVVRTEDEVFYMYKLINKSVIMRYVLTQTGTEGHLQRMTWVEKTNSWVNLVSIPRDRCDDYSLCGVYSTCDSTNVAVCQCLKKFIPKSPLDWSRTDWSQGCERETSLNCTEGDGFIKYTGVKLPETTGTWFNTNMNLEECRVKCLKNCSCMAYANTDIRGDGSGCIMWFTELTDIRQLNNAGQDLYIRMAASEIDLHANSKMKKRVIIIVVITLVTGMIVLGLGIWYLLKKRSLKGDHSEKEDLELPLYDLVTITKATNNFSEENKLGKGGFGPVYKGQLEGGQEIAVKRLSKDSIQGVDEFKNEVLLISKLQHRNLVRLLGCCIQGEEKMLVYEYMQNKCLHSFIFNETKSKLLDWQNRFDIILGIARGVLYLHHDSRLRIIHRDLKASNILLDGEMVPKISDFGIARIFRGNRLQESTKRVVGTHGYMSPEYAVDGHFSVKSDVFSYGVLVLEIISGKKNRGFWHPDHELNLLGHAWRLWNEDNCMEIVDDLTRNSASAQDIIRCIHVGLLCVQKSSERRPTMSSVLLMLCSETVVLPNPQLPGFYIERGPINDHSSNSEKELRRSNDATITMLLEGR
ncbi:hypothetical protein AQUCO_02800279v1, partial [Aquilegia coerulea]